MGSGKNLTAEIMRQALRRLDESLNRDVTLIVGGGGALILAHGLTLSTADIDAVPKAMDLSEIEDAIKRVAADLSLAPDWLNPYFATFTHTLPSDYGDRLVEVHRGARLTALALGKEEMLIMKCFAGRKKDVAHARDLLRKGVDVRKVEAHIESLVEKGISGANEALDFLDELLE